MNGNFFKKTWVIATIAAVIALFVGVGIGGSEPEVKTVTKTITKEVPAEPQVKVRTEVPASCTKALEAAATLFTGPVSNAYGYISVLMEVISGEKDISVLETIAADMESDTPIVEKQTNIFSTNSDLCLAKAGTAS